MAFQVAQEDAGAVRSASGGMLGAAFVGASDFTASAPKRSVRVSIALSTAYVRGVAIFATLLVALLASRTAAADANRTLCDLSMADIASRKVDITSALTLATGAKQINKTRVAIPGRNLQLEGDGEQKVYLVPGDGFDSLWTSWPALPELEISKNALHAILPTAAHDIVLIFRARLSTADDGAVCTTVQLSCAPPTNQSDNPTPAPSVAPSASASAAPPPSTPTAAAKSSLACSDKLSDAAQRSLSGSTLYVLVDNKWVAATASVDGSFAAEAVCQGKASSSVAWLQPGGQSGVARPVSIQSDTSKATVKLSDTCAGDTKALLERLDSKATPRSLILSYVKVEGTSAVNRWNCQLDGAHDTPAVCLPRDMADLEHLLARSRDFQNAKRRRDVLDGALEVATNTRDSASRALALGLKSLREAIQQKVVDPAARPPLIDAVITLSGLAGPKEAETSRDAIARMRTAALTLPSAAHDALNPLIDDVAGEATAYVAADIARNDYNAQNPKADAELADAARALAPLSQHVGILTTNEPLTVLVVRQAGAPSRVSADGTPSIQGLAILGSDQGASTASPVAKALSEKSPPACVVDEWHIAPRAAGSLKVSAKLVDSKGTDVPNTQDTIELAVETKYVGAVRVGIGFIFPYPSTHNYSVRPAPTGGSWIYEDSTNPVDMELVGGYTVFLPPRTTTHLGDPAFGIFAGLGLVSVAPASGTVNALTSGYIGPEFSVHGLSISLLGGVKRETVLASGYHVTSTIVAAGTAVPTTTNYVPALGVMLGFTSDVLKIANTSVP